MDREPAIIRKLSLPLNIFILNILLMPSTGCCDSKVRSDTGVQSHKVKPTYVSAKPMRRSALRICRAGCLLLVCVARPTVGSILTDPSANLLIPTVGPVLQFLHFLVWFHVIL